MTLGQIRDSGVILRSRSGWQLQDSHKPSRAGVQKHLLLRKEDVCFLGSRYRWGMQIQQIRRTESALAPRFRPVAGRYAGLVADDDLRSNAELLAAHLEGDSEAFTIIVARNSSLVWSVALKITGNSVDAADVYQDAFLAAHRSASSFKGKSALATWLYRITVNAALSQMRKAQNTAAHQITTDDSFADIPAQGTGAHPDKVDVCMDVASALSVLSEDQQRAVVLVDMFGYSQVEAAEVLQIPEGTVKSRLFRARKTLAGDLEHLSPAMRGVRGVDTREDEQHD